MIKEKLKEQLLASLKEAVFEPSKEAVFEPSFTDRTSGHYRADPEIKARRIIRAKEKPSDDIEVAHPEDTPEKKFTFNPTLNDLFGGTKIPKTTVVPTSQIDKAIKRIRYGGTEKVGNRTIHRIADEPDTNESMELMEAKEYHVYIPKELAPHGKLHSTTDGSKWEFKKSFGTFDEADNYADGFSHQVKIQRRKTDRPTYNDVVSHHLGENTKINEWSDETNPATRPADINHTIAAKTHRLLAKKAMYNDAARNFHTKEAEKHEKLMKENVELDESKKKIGEYSHGSNITKIYKLTGEHDEGDPYVVHLHRNGKHYEPADYFTNDLDDAHGTAKHMVREEIELEEMMAPVYDPLHKAAADHVAIKNAAGRKIGMSQGDINAHISHTWKTHPTNLRHARLNKTAPSTISLNSSGGLKGVPIAPNHKSL